jgi:hypothetical protein
MGRYVYTEKDVIDAIFDITECSLSQYQASDKYGVPQPVLSKRLSGQKSRKESTHPHQRVSTSQEGRLVRWLLRQESLGYALTHSQNCWNSSRHRALLHCTQMVRRKRAGK